MTPITVTQEQIDECFADKADGHEVFVALHDLLYPPELAIKLDGWPEAGQALHDYVTEHFIAYDRQHHPGALAGGLWLSRGWGLDRLLGEWEVVPAPYEPI